MSAAQARHPVPATPTQLPSDLAIRAFSSQHTTQTSNQYFFEVLTFWPFAERPAMLVNAIELTRRHRVDPTARMVFVDPSGQRMFLHFSERKDTSGERCEACKGRGTVSRLDHDGEYQQHCQVCDGSGWDPALERFLDSDVVQTDSAGHVVADGGDFDQRVKDALNPRKAQPEGSARLLCIETAQDVVDAFYRWQSAQSEAFKQKISQAA